MTIKDYVRSNEGTCLHAYYDTEGHLTVGVGHMVLNGDMIEPGETITDSRSEVLFAMDLAKAIDDVRHMEGFKGITLNRYMALVDLRFQLGLVGLLKFHNFLFLMRMERYEAAAAELLNSEYARQVPKRAVRNAEMIRNG